MPRLLLHSCCAPCSTAVLERLTPDYDVTLFYYNPNVLPLPEYERRLHEQERIASAFGVPMLTGAYHPDYFKAVIAGLEHLPENSARCTLCYTLRLEETAKTAAVMNMDVFTTTLTMSSKKNAEHINDIAADVARKYAVRRLWADFKKGDGYNRSVALCKQYNIYRQEYCGCVPLQSNQS
ncbi:MAG: epoxyqueuosine reductase QueH [Oscillospiraceae bacterium]|nr:epoxyqueuosine reductase QueH [Oscillospiraceae bacterium]